MERKDRERQTGREAATEPRGPRDVVRRARENAVRARYLEGLDVTPIARGKVDQTAAKRKKGKSNTDSGCSAIHVCTITARLETLCCRKQLETLGCSKPGVLACRHYMTCPHMVSLC